MADKDTSLIDQLETLADAKKLLDEVLPTKTPEEIEAAKKPSTLGTLPVIKGFLTRLLSPAKPEVNDEGSGEADDEEKPAKRNTGFAWTRADLKNQRDEARQDLAAKEKAFDLQSGELATAFNERDAARQETAAANRRIAELQREAIAADNVPREQLARTQSALQAITVERDAAVVGWNKEKVNVSRMESFMGVRGVSVNDLPDIANEDEMTSGDSLHKTWSNLKGAAKTEFFRKHEAALLAYSGSMQAAAKDREELRNGGGARGA